MAVSNLGQVGTEDIHDLHADTKLWYYCYGCVVLVTYTNLQSAVRQAQTALFKTEGISHSSHPQVGLLLFIQYVARHFPDGESIESIDKYPFCGSVVSYEHPLLILSIVLSILSSTFSRKSRNAESFLGERGGTVTYLVWLYIQKV